MFHALLGKARPAKASGGANPQTSLAAHHFSDLPDEHTASLLR
jgi:hypothetical protein